MEDSLSKLDIIGPEVRAVTEKKAMEEIFKELQEGIKRKKVRLSDLEIKVLDLQMWRKINSS